jgi:hypothetical protein
MHRSLRRRGVALTALVASSLAIGSAVALATDGGSDGGQGMRAHQRDRLAHVDILTPQNGDRAGIGSRGWFVDLAVDFRLPLEKTGFNPADGGADGLQLTGPPPHANAAPFPGAFGAGQDDRFKGLIVLVSTDQAGQGRNLAGLFNMTGVTDRSPYRTQIQDTWIVGAPGFGRNVPSTVYAAIAADRNGNGILDDAPAAVPDADRDGDVDARDLRAFGVTSNIARADFVIRD